ncbi:MAG: HAMP domain-containing protein, partial [Burkholderiaceae bacterium]|nr:HAMP domain-containing protein [Burkholderiaceae bacterium]
MNIKTRLIGFGAISLLFSVTMGCFGIWGERHIIEAVEKNATSAAAMRHHMEADMMHDALRSDVLGAAMAAQNSQPAARAAIQKQLAEHTDLFIEALAANEKLPLPAEIQQAIRAARPAVDAYIKLSQQMVAQAFDAPTDFSARMAEFNAAFSALEPRMETLSDMIEKDAAESTASAKEASDDSVALSTALMLAAAIFLTGASAMLIRSILGSLAQVRRAVEGLASGDADLRQRLPKLDGEFDHVAAALNRFLDNVAGVASRVSESALTIAEVTHQAAAHNADLSSRTEAQAGSLEKTASTMEELTNAVRDNAANADKANSLASQATEIAQHGGAVVDQVVHTMASIKESSRKIVDIISVIDGIAFQTNILALNAAVEAARAGEQGRGFAVVAAEVRTLAQRSATAAKEIKELIGNSVETVGAGDELVREAGQIMERVVTSVTEVAGIMHHIRSASAEQSHSIAQAHQAITSIDQLTQQNAHMVSEQSEGANSIGQQVQELVSTISIFNVT